MPDVTNVLYNLYADKNLNDSFKILYNWEEVYYSKQYSDDTSLPIDKRESEKYKNTILRAITKYGLMSMYIQTQYYVSFTSQGTRFTTIEILRELEIFSNGKLSENYLDIRDCIDNTDTEHVYFVVGAIDPATDKDYAAFSAGVAKVRKSDREVIDYQLKVIKIMNPDLKSMSPDTLIKKSADLCAHYMVDMVIIDSSAAQKDRAYYLWKKLKEIECDTMVIPFSYGGGSGGSSNKQLMMRKFEEAMTGKRISFPNEEERLVDEYYNEYVEEILYLQKITEENKEGRKKILYYAPQVAGFFDDCVMATAQGNFLCYYIKMFLVDMSKKNKKIDLGDGITYKLTYHKNSGVYKQKEQKENIMEEFGVGRARNKKRSARIGVFRR